MLMKGKKPWLSKTLWVNLLAIIALFFQWIFGFDLPAAIQVSILGAVNLWLRHITTEPITWTENGDCTKRSEAETGLSPLSGADKP